MPKVKQVGVGVYSTYVELIVGLPGETYSSFVEGLNALMEAGQHDGLSIYLCMLLTNTEMSTCGRPRSCSFSRWLSIRTASTMTCECSRANMSCVNCCHS